MNRVLATVIAVLTGAAVYCAMVGSVAKGDLLIGVVLGGAAVALTRSLPREVGTQETPLSWRTPVDAVLFAAAVGWAVAIGTGRVVGGLFRRDGAAHAGFVECPLGERTARGSALGAFVTTLAPGSVLVELDLQRRRAVFHVLDARDPDAFRLRFDQFYRRFQRRLLP